MGFYYSVMIVGALPLVLHIALNDTHGNDRDAIESDIADNLYSRYVYIVTTVSSFYLHNSKIIMFVLNKLNVFKNFFRFCAVSLHLF